MSRKLSQAMLMGIATFAFAAVAHGQHNFDYTKTVDPSGRADFTRIQDAIDSITPTTKYTVLIYSGTYNENVTLDGEDENIDLVGIDRDGVIIAPSSGDGIVITSGTETSRNNSIRNLTIKTDSGHGISIVKGGTPVPKDIFIEGVTIEATGTAKDGIVAIGAQDLRVFNVKIATQDGHGVEFRKSKAGAAPRNIAIELASITARGKGKNGIDGSNAENVRVFGCSLRAADGVPIQAGKNWNVAGAFTPSPN